MLRSIREYDRLRLIFVTFFAIFTPFRFLSVFGLVALLKLENSVSSLNCIANLFKDY